MKLSTENYEYLVVNVLHPSKRTCFICLNKRQNSFGRLSKLLTKKALIPSLVHDNTEAHSDKEKAEMLSAYFAKSWNILVHNSVHKISTSVNWIILSLTTLLAWKRRYIISSKPLIATSKAAGPDGISVRILLEIGSAIASSL